MNTLTYTCHTLTLDYSRNKEIEEVNLDLSKLIEFNYMNIFEISDKVFTHVKIISEYSLDELIRIYEGVM